MEIVNVSIDRPKGSPDREGPDVLLAVMLLPFAVIWEAFVIQKGWNWFITTEWNIQAPSLWVIMGIDLLLGVVISQYTRIHEAKSLVNFITGKMMKNLLALGMMYLIFSLRNINIVW
jgi:hypothetical protein